MKSALNVNRAVTKAKKTNFHLYTHFFNLPLTARRESKFVEVVDGCTTHSRLNAFTIAHAHDVILKRNPSSELPIVTA